VGALPTVPPGERWIVDFHGSFPATSSDDKRYILVFIDSASLWPEMVAVRDTSAETVVQSLFDCIISLWGFPKQIDLQSDNGSGFKAKLTDLCCRTFGITQYFTTPYRPQPQSKVESHAKVIHQTLKVLTNNKTGVNIYQQCVCHIVLVVRLVRKFPHMKPCSLGRFDSLLIGA